MSEQLIARYTTTHYDVSLQNTTNAFATSFLGKSSKINKCSFSLGTHGSPAGTAVAKLYAMTGSYGSDGKPTGSALATSNTRSASDFSGGGWYDFTFSGAEQYLMSDGFYYEISIEYTGTSTDYVVARYEYDSGPNSGKRVTTTWSALEAGFNPIVAFYVYGTTNYILTAQVGVFVLTGISAILSKFHSYIMTTTVGQFILTGIAVVLTKAFGIWDNQTKSSTSSFTNEAKHNISPVGKNKSTTSTFTNKDKS
jgi:hypothetical protein